MNILIRFIFLNSDSSSIFSRFGTSETARVCIDCTVRTATRPQSLRCNFWKTDWSWRAATTERSSSGILSKVLIFDLLHVYCWSSRQWFAGIRWKKIGAKLYVSLFVWRSLREWGIDTSTPNVCINIVCDSATEYSCVVIWLWYWLTIIILIILTCIAGEFVRDVVKLDSGGSGGCIWRLKCTDSLLACAVGSRNGTEDTKLILIDFDASYPWCELKPTWRHVKLLVYFTHLLYH